MNLDLIPKLKHTHSNNFFLLAGPCAIEGEEMAMQIAEKIMTVTDSLEIPFIFKGSFKKANRSRIDSFTGIGDEKALEILKKVSEKFNIPTVTDIHEVSDAQLAAPYVDVLQIPAFLVRQTDLVVAAAKTGKVVNLKKGQFMSPESMQHAVQKVLDCGKPTSNYYRSRYHVWLSRYVGGLSRNSHDATICAYDPRHHSQLTATQPNKWCYRRKA